MSIENKKILSIFFFIVGFFFGGWLTIYHPDISNASGVMISDTFLADSSGSDTMQAPEYMIPAPSILINGSCLLEVVGGRNCRKKLSQKISTRLEDRLFDSPLTLKIQLCKSACQGKYNKIIANKKIISIEIEHLETDAINALTKDAKNKIMSLGLSLQENERKNRQIDRLQQQAISLLNVQKFPEPPVSQRRLILLFTCSDSCHKLTYIAIFGNLPPN